MALFSLFTKKLTLVALCCATPAIAMYNDEIRKPSGQQPCVLMDTHDYTHRYSRPPCNPPDETDYYSRALHYFHLGTFQEIKKRPQTAPPTTVSATINALMKMNPHELQTLAQESCTESLSSARCNTTIKCCLLAGTLASAAYHVPLIISAPTCSETTLPLAKTMCILTCGGCGALYTKRKADNNYRNAKDWQRLYYPVVINMPAHTNALPK
jgi:hypothetical protein